MRNTPPMTETIFKYFEIFSIYREAEPIPKAINKNGIASPRENIDSNAAPWKAVAEVEAKSKIAPRIGPTQGVQPKPKADPRIRELTGLPSLNTVGALNFISLAKNGILKTFSINNPKIITKTPPIRVSHI